MKRLIYIGIYTLLIILGIVFAAFYFRAYREYSNDIVYFVFSSVCFAEAVFTAVSFFFYIRKIHNRATMILKIVAVVCCIPILLVTTFWFLYFIGFKIIPPPQQ